MASTKGGKKATPVAETGKKGKKQKKVKKKK